MAYAYERPVLLALLGEADGLGISLFNLILDLLSKLLKLVKSTLNLGNLHLILIDTVDSRLPMLHWTSIALDFAWHLFRLPLNWLIIVL